MHCPLHNPGKRPGSKNKLAYNQKLLNSKEQDATKLEANSWLPLTKLKPPIKTHPVLNNSES